jgi:hypothetical protein
MNAVPVKSIAVPVISIAVPVGFELFGRISPIEREIHATVINKNKNKNYYQQFDTTFKY